MKKTLLLVKLLIIAVVFNANAQIGFEGLLTNYENGKHLNGSFHSNNYSFVNYYNNTYASWSGFAYSKMTDTITAGFTNQYSAMAGSGYNESKNFLVSFVSSWDGSDYIKFDTATALNKFYITNSTYAYISMRDGDMFAKKFGGDTGNDEDWFLLTIRGYNNGVYTDSINFYLADYRFADNTQDYIIKNWTLVDLTELLTIDSITFSLTSSDVGDYGMSTPSCFCMDNLTNENNIVTDFEEFDFDYWNGSDLSGGFDSEEGHFFNIFNTTYNSWSGFAYSRKTDITTVGYSNQYSAIMGEGNNNSETYGVGYCYGASSIKLDNTYHASSVYITNSTYAYFTMLNGNMFTQKFGGDTGNDEDWFLLTIKGYNNGYYTDSVNFYLADYRFSDNEQDYIINKWTEVDINTLGNVDSLAFTLTSSDVGDYGMNTPAYFCIDDLNLTSTFAENIIESNINIYPNPIKNILNITNINNSDINIYNLSGQIIYSEKVYQDNIRIDFSDFQNGVYIISVKNNSEIKTYKIIKQ